MDKQTAAGASVAPKLSTAERTLVYAVILAATIAVFIIPPELVTAIKSVVEYRYGEPGTVIAARAHRTSVAAYIMGYLCCIAFSVRALAASRQEYRFLNRIKKWCAYGTAVFLTWTLYLTFWG